MVCEGELNFDLAEKKPDAAKYQISEVSTNIRKTRKCKLDEILKKVVAERTDPLAVESAAKLSYTSCIHAEEVKYHRDCRQRFLSHVTVIPGPISYKHFVVSSKNDEFNNFCDWYESTRYDTTPSFTLFEKQKHIEDNNSEVYSIRHLSRKWSER